MNWIFKLWKRMQLLRTRDLSFKMEMEAENTVSGSALDINMHIASVLTGLRSMRVRLEQLRTRLVETFFTTDPWGNKTPLVQPAFTADRVSKLHGQRIGVALAVLVFVLCEVSLYYLISESLMGSLEGTVRSVGVWGIALVFALFVLFAYAISLNTLFDFIDARELRKEARISKQAYNAAVTYLVIGTIVFIGSFAFLTYAGVARINLIENASTAANRSIDPALRAVLEEGNHASGTMALLFTYVMAIVLGYLKRSLHKASAEWAAYKAWKANVSEQERLVKRIGEVESGIVGHIQKELERGVQLCHDLQRTYGQQFDPSHADLFKQYVAERSKPDFTVTRDVLNTYRPLIVADEQLFTAAVVEKASLKALQGAAASEVMPALSSLDVLYAGLAKPTTQQAALPPAKRPELPQNGQAKDIDAALKDLLKA